MKSFDQFLGEAEDADNSEGALKYVKKEGDNWYLVSKYTGKHLRDFGSTKPSREEADKALRTIEFFKHESVNEDSSFASDSPMSRLRRHGSNWHLHSKYDDNKTHNFGPSRPTRNEIEAADRQHDADHKKTTTLPL